MKKIIIWKQAWFLSLICLVALIGCRKEPIVVSTTDAVNMTAYLDKHPEQFSELTKVLKLTGIASFLNAYGTYTFFAPNNDAIKAYLVSLNKNSVEDVSTEDWKGLMRFHLLEDSLKTSRFKDGKLSSLTMYGQYLTTSAVLVGDQTKIRINRQANILAPNISVGNGILHIIDNVLRPSVKSVAELVAENDRYNIFEQALRETGLYDTLNILPVAGTDTEYKWYSLIAESDSALQAAGFPDFEALKMRYSNTGNPKSINDSLNLFVRYHILNDAKYLADIVLTNSHLTIAPSQVLTSKLVGTTVLINDDEYNGVHEQGFPLIRNRSDVSATNGVLHDASSHFNIKLRLPYPVYYDVCTMSDLVRMRDVYQKVAEYKFTTQQTAAMSEIKFSGNATDMYYRWGGSGKGGAPTSYNRDVLSVPIGTTSRSVWVEFKSPMLIKGRYKIWVCYYVQQASSSNGGSTCEVVASIGADGSAERKDLTNSRVLSFITKRPGRPADEEEAIGWKTYMENTAGSQTSRMMGIADIEQTGRYWLRLTAINGTQSTNNVDMIHFIPINMDQQYPKFKPDGTPIPRP